MSRPVLQKTTLEVRVPLHAWWKAEAARRRLTMVGFMEMLLEREQAKDDRTRARRLGWAAEDAEDRKAKDKAAV